MTCLKKVVHRAGGPLATLALILALGGSLSIAGLVVAYRAEVLKSVETLHGPLIKAR